MIRFGAFDAVHPNGIVALGDGKAIFGIRFITRDTETGELVSGRELDLWNLPLSPIGDSESFSVEWKVGGKKARLAWQITAQRELYARVSCDGGLRVFLECYVPWRRRLEGEWVNYGRQSDRVFTGEYVSPFRHPKINALRLITSRPPLSAAGYNDTAAEYRAMKEEGRAANVAPGEIWCDMGIWWQYGIALEGEFSFLLTLGAARGFLPLPTEEEADRLLLAAEKRAARKEKKPHLSGRGLYRPLCEALTSALHYNTVYQYNYGKRYVITDRTWTRDDTGFGILFNWDTYLSSLAAAWCDPLLAKENMLAAYATQLPDGRIPLHTRAVDGAAEPPITAGRCQHIVHGLTLWQVYLHTKDKKWLRECYEKCKRVHAWWHTHRDPLGLSLFTFGYDPEEEMGILGAHTQPYVGKAQYAYFETYDDSPQWTTGDYFRSTKGLSDVKDADCRDEAKYNEKTHTANIYTLERSCLFALECLYLEKAARELGEEEDARRFLAEYERVKEAVNGRMWNEEAGCYYNLHFDGTLSSVQTPDCFLPIAAGIADEERTKRLLSLLTDEGKFWGEYPAPSVSRDHPAFPMQKYWRGSIWPPMVLWTYYALRESAPSETRWEFAERVGRMLAREWEEKGFIPENYSAITGRCSGAAHYNWGVLMAIPLLCETVEVAHDRITFGNPHAPVGSAVENIPLDGHLYSVFVTEEGTAVLRDGILLAEGRGHVTVLR